MATYAELKETIERLRSQTERALINAEYMLASAIEDRDELVKAGETFDPASRDHKRIQLRIDRYGEQVDFAKTEAEHLKQVSRLLTNLQP